MQSKNRFLSIVTVAIVLAVTSMVSFAQETKTEAPKTDKVQKIEKRQFQGRFDGTCPQCGMGRMGRMGRMGHMGGMMAMRGGAMRGIGLTDAQKEQIKAIREANKPDPALRDELRTIRQSRKAGADLTAEQIARIHAIQDQMRIKSQNTHDQIQNVLTAEQKAEFTKRRTEMQSRREQMMKRSREFRQQRMNRPADPAKPAETKKPTI